MGLLLLRLKLQLRRRGEIDRREHRGRHLALRHNRRAQRGLLIDEGVQLVAADLLDEGLLRLRHRGGAAGLVRRHAGGHQLRRLGHTEVGALDLRGALRSGLTHPHLPSDLLREQILDGLDVHRAQLHGVHEGAEGLGEGLHVAEALGGLRIARLRDEGRQRLCVAAQICRDLGDGGRVGAIHLPGQQLIEHGPEAVDVCPAVDRAIFEDLRGQVGGAARVRLGLGEGGPRQGLIHREVGELEHIRQDEHVLRLEIAVGSVAVGVAEGHTDLAQDRLRLKQAEPLAFLPPQPHDLAQGQPLKELHREHVLPIDDDLVIEPHDVLL